ncbi:Mss4-like protein [Fomitopsis serialis]|uniref:Mss4-like protein n=1 Tax=Fomitopsis serialis TaxID=139415 RepID=UPI0020082C54|nr:Mss4-like protein [Neoantrodia serialis]KAH9922630.1 Mss4-like protein [Neoantrodia serialis]
MKDTEGSCHCGAVKLRIHGEINEDTKAGICHCKDCQLFSGSLFAYAGKVDRENLQVVQGQPKSYKQPTDTSLSGKQVTRHFCGDCGTPLWVESDATPTIYAVKLALFANNFAPGIEIFWQNAHDWEKPMAPPELVFDTLPAMPPTA